MINLAPKITELFNFDDKEAKVYLASLELGRSKASDIAKKSGLNRITAYEILKRLISRGLASAINYEKVKYFQVASPERLLEKMERQTEMAKEYLPELSLLSKSGKGRPKVEFYEGTEGLRLIYDDTLNCKEKVLYNIANPKDLYPFMGPDFIVNYIKQRRRKRVLTRLLLPNVPENYHYKGEKEKTELRDVRFIDNKSLPIPNEILIYDDKVALLSFTGKIGVIVEDKDIATSLKSIWQMLWNSAKPNPK